MKLDASFIRLPHRFDPDAALEQIDQLGAEAWRAHPRGWADHRMVPLVTVDGEDDATRMIGTMKPTAQLDALPAITHLLGALDTVVGRTLLVRAESGAKAERMIDAGAYWHRRVRVFMPLASTARAVWTCAEDQTPIPAGQAWLVNGWGGYGYDNGADEALIYVVVDTIGSASFWNTVRSADRPLEPERADQLSPRQISLREQPRTFDTETVRGRRIMPPAEMENLVGTVMADLRSSVPADAPHLPKLESVLDQFIRQWQAIDARHGEDSQGDPAYRQALEQLVAQAAMFAGAWRLPNGLDAAQLLYQTIVADALKDKDGNPVVIKPPGTRPPAPAPQAAPASAARPGQPQRTPTTTEASPQPAARPGAAQRAPARPPANAAAGGGTSSGTAQDPEHSPLRSVHTGSFPQLLKQIASSVLVSTYQAGKLVVLREAEGKLNTHFRVYNRPMGLAADRSRLAIGTALAVEYYRNMPLVAARLEPAGRHDGAFLPRQLHVTGNIDVHEMAWAGDELWLVNTRFSCLCTLDGEHSFVPRWRPSFISGYAAEDRCHLNGLEVIDGKPRYVTALGTSDVAGGWRENKASGGVLIDVDSGEMICRGLSMPHSPRWYQDRLWVLESGNGSLATVDLDTGRVETVAELPGFTRGLTFYGPYALVGLSQVRESAVFSGISLTERVSERNCGVWIVDIRSGQVAGFLRFEDAVQEVFAVSILPGLRFPDVLAATDQAVGISYALPDEALKEVVQPPARNPHSGG